MTDAIDDTGTSTGTGTGREGFWKWNGRIDYSTFKNGGTVVTYSLTDGLYHMYVCTYMYMDFIFNSTYVPR